MFTERRALGVFLLFLLASVSCKKQRNDSAVLVTDGIETNLFPAVMKLWRASSQGACTAVLVERGVFLTAAHCVLQPDEKTPSPLAGMTVGRDGFRNNATKVIVHPQYIGSREVRRESHDLALVFVTEVPQLESVPPLRICNRIAARGEPVTLVGYGRTDSKNSAAPLDDGGAGTKRRGSNRVYEIREDAISLRGKTNWRKDTDPPAPPGELSVAGKGDSGGPLIAPCGIVGITSTGDDIRSGRYIYGYSYYAALSSLSSIEFLGNALKVGSFPEAPGAEHWTAIYTARDRPHNMTYEEATKLCHRNDFAKRFRLATIEELVRSAKLVERSAVGPGCVWSRSKSDNRAFPISAFAFGGGSGHDGPFSASPSGACQAFCVRVVEPEPSAAETATRLLNLSIQRIYQSCLERDASEAELSTWRADGRVDEALATAICESLEGRGRAIVSAWKICLQRDPKDEELRTWQSRPGTRAELTEAICDSPEARKVAIKDVYLYQLGRSASEQEIQFWFDQPGSIQEILEQIANSAEGRASAIRRYYDRYLERAPSAAEVQFWQNRPESLRELGWAIRDSEEAERIRNAKP